MRNQLSHISFIYRKIVLGGYPSDQKAIRLKLLLDTDLIPVYNTCCHLTLTPKNQHPSGETHQKCQSNNVKLIEGDFLRLLWGVAQEIHKNQVFIRQANAKTELISRFETALRIVQRENKLANQAQRLTDSLSDIVTATDWDKKDSSRAATRARFKRILKENVPEHLLDNDYYIDNFTVALKKATGDNDENIPKVLYDVVLERLRYWYFDFNPFPLERNMEYIKKAQRDFEQQFGKQLNESNLHNVALAHTKEIESFHKPYIDQMASKMQNIDKSGGVTDSQKAAIWRQCSERFILEISPCKTYAH